jgi:amino acid adenylation domain-containing protein
MASALAGVRIAPAPLRRAERERLARWGGSGEPIEPSRCIHDLFRDQALRAPDAPAVRFRGKTTTYAELDAAAERLADWLAAAGVGMEEVVAVHLERSAELIVALLGVLKAGAAYLALDPGSPHARMAYMLRDAAPRLVLTQARLRGTFPDGGLPVLCLDAEWAAVEQAPPRAPAAVDVHNLAYVSYTSGSTGQPKGVCATHAGVARFVRLPNWAEFLPGDVWLHLSPVAFDASTLEIYGALVNGACVAVHPPGPVVPDEVAETLRGDGVTILWLTAGLFHRLADARLDAFAGVRHLVAGGDVVSPAHARRLLEAHPRLRFTNGYGPTENTILTACWTTERPVERGTVPIGRPVGGTSVVLLDPGLRQVGPTEHGELCAGGVGVARCYLNRAAETAEKFVPDPLSTRPGARLYRTGDVARWRPDGTLEFLGRVDHQVKVRGFRVELGEVEATLTRHPAVRDAVVVAHDDGRGGKSLTGYFVAAGPADPALPAAELPPRLRVYLRERLPSYMVPRVLVELPAIPLTEVGKVDRAVLPPAADAPRSVANDYVAPRTPLERHLAELWARLLAVHPVGAEDDFFEMGGHSLLVAELVEELEAELGVEVPSRTLYLQPTVAELATSVEALRAAREAEAAHA